MLKRGVIIFFLLFYALNEIKAQSDYLVVPFYEGPSDLNPEIQESEEGTTDFSDFESLPGAPNVLYLDFDGEYVVSSSWNFGSPINATPSPFSASEKLMICQLVASDFEPFEVNITTKLSVFNAASKTQRQQIIFTDFKSWYGSAGGVAKYGTFYSPSDVVCWVFQSEYRAAAKTASHELGHTIGLKHQGTSTSEYYGGHGDWNAIMGNAVKTMTQWSKGEYPDANNKSDELAAISRFLFYKTDDWGSSINSPSNFTGLIDASNNFSGTGLISETTDKDIFIFSTTGGNFNLNFGCAGEGLYTNLRLEAAILNEDGSVFYTDVTSSKSKVMNVYLPAGTYYLQFDGVGYLTPTTGGYSDYGSLGKYQFSGKISSFTNTYEIAIIGIEQLEKHTCTENIKAKVYVQNFGDAIINQYSLKIKDSKGDIQNKLINSSIQPNEIDSIEFEFTPTNFNDYSFSAELTSLSDTKSSNNSFTSNSTQYLFGENIKFQLTEESAFKSGTGWNWKVYNENKSKVIISSIDLEKVSEGVFITQNFCLPSDSCFEFQMEKPFVTNWCDFGKYSDYLIFTFPPDHIFQAGDTIMVFGATGQELYEIQNQIDVNTVNSSYPYDNTNYFKPIKCELPSGLNPLFSFTKVSDGSELFGEKYRNDKTVFSKEVCTYQVITSVAETTADSDVIMYPNPTNGLVNFKTSTTINNITIYDARGSVVFIQDNATSINLSNLSKGVYFVSIMMTNQKREVKTLLVN